MASDWDIVLNLKKYGDGLGDNQHLDNFFRPSLDDSFFIAEVMITTFKNCYEKT